MFVRFETGPGVQCGQKSHAQTEARFNVIRFVRKYLRNILDGLRFAIDNCVQVIGQLFEKLQDFR